MTVSHADHPAGDHGATRRDFLYYATAGAGVVAAGAAGWTLINQMNPSADVQALSSIQVDISAVAEGTQLTVKWLGKPVFIRHRTADEIERARADDDAALIDPLAENANKPGEPATDANRALDEEGKWLVMIGVCTHLGCVPIGDGAGDFGGWFCPCHGSHYDASGRIRRGPAPQNLHIPVASFVNDTTIKLG
ncbi:ubiquinol-cytochrome c reductase iron-sulfur subunit [Paracoccus sanguinis]|uniref:ubiquinol-cytochrome c reductase iron-sulfur subunit n=1 Tax=Paracoccus sanguinis TaxID=1545044 RepID=UPI003CC81C4C